MAVIEEAGVVIRYEEGGRGPALLTCAPGGMRSQARFWRVSPGRPDQPPPWIDPMRELAGSFRVIEMDQRNTGGSSAPIRAGDGWHSYAQDQLLLLDRLGVDRFAVMGGCIGCSFALRLAREVPDRVTALVLQNPIGRSPGNLAAFQAMFDGWAAELALDPATAAALGAALFGGDFVFSVERADVRALRCPVLVLPGDDDFHPRSIALEIAGLAPRARVLEGWTGDRAETAREIKSFLLGAVADP